MHKTIGILLALMLVLCFASTASAANEIETNNISNETSSTQALLPYAEINAYGSTQVDAGEETDIYVSGEIGGITIYVEKFHVTDLNTGRAIAESDYTAKASGSNWVFAGGQWSEFNNVVGHETFNQHWGVTIDEPGMYEVKAVVVGLGGMPAEQDTLTLTVS
jgi:hypothetical protein